MQRENELKSYPFDSGKKGKPLREIQAQISGESKSQSLQLAH
jgi:hypothetical protein